MIELSMSEIALLIWAIGATAGFVQTREELKGAKAFLRAMIENEGVRNRVVRSFEELKAKGEL